jgi:hypothetical protein
MFRPFASLILLCLCGVVSGCAFFRPPVVAGNPIFVPANNEDELWERTINVVHDYFDIGRESRMVGSTPGIIETRWKVGSGLLEPWQRDSHGLENRIESTLLSIRRRAQIDIMPVPGGYQVSILVIKEIEDLPGVAYNTAGGATFPVSNPLQRDLDLVTGQASPSGWVPRGRDENLEAEMLRRMQWAFMR